MIEKIRGLPREQKIRFIWTAAILTAILMAVLWIFTSRIGKITNRDTSLFDTVGKGIRDIKNDYNNR